MSEKSRKPSRGCQIGPSVNWKPVPIWRTGAQRSMRSAKPGRTATCVVMANPSTAIGRLFMPPDLIPYIGNQLRVGRLCTTGPGTAMSIRPITCPPAIFAGLSCTGSRNFELESSFLIAAFSSRLETP